MTATALATIATQAPTLLSIVEVLPLTTEAEIARATEVLRTVKSLEKMLETERKALVEPLKSEASEIDARYREPRRALEKIEAMLKARIAEVHRLADQARTAALTAASAAAQAGDHAAASSAVIAAAAPPPETPGISIRYKWTPLCKDAALIPREYLTIDTAKLAALARDAGSGPAPVAIPGIEWYREPIVAARGA